MRLSTRARYAVMAMVELAARQRLPGSGLLAGAALRGCVSRRRAAREAACGSAEGRPVSLAELAQAQLLPLPYMEQLFAGLRRAGLVVAVRGPGGGYRLTRPAEAIRIAEVVDAVDESLRTTRCEGDSPGCLAGQRCLAHDLWSELGVHIRLFLGALSLADVIECRVLGRAAAPRDALPTDGHADMPAPPRQASAGPPAGDPADSPTRGSTGSPAGNPAGSPLGSSPGTPPGNRAPAGGGLDRPA
ncbi:Rrf2 family transcriptional regulator [Roseomonas acroporae]|uniref:Rrf2 family transcriptional regulator n=1 Tax=Roseomonas acroporae TaxID=2937791 RepID=UPI0031F48036